MSKSDLDGRAANLRFKGKGYVGGALILLFLIFMAMVISVIVFDPLSAPKSLYGLLAWALIIPFILAVAGSIKQDEAYERLEELLGITQQARDELKKSLADASEFIDVYRPQNDDIRLVLEAAANAVHRACEAENEFYHHGMKGIDATKLPKDPEERAAVLQDRFETGLAQLKAKVKATKADFWRVWQLAKDRGYDLLPSWQPYAGLPWDEKDSARKMVDAAVVLLARGRAEGKNEPAFKDKPGAARDKVYDEDLTRRETAEG